MTDISAVGSSSLDPWSGSLDDDECRKAAGSLPPRPASARDPSEIPDLPDANGGLLARAANAASTPRLLLATGIASGDVANVDSAATPIPAVERRLDAFRAAATPTYRLPDGTTVSVATPFRMPARQEGQLTAAEKKDSTAMRYAAQEGRVESHKAELTAIAAKVGIGEGGLVALHFGRGTPEQVHAVTQALIEAGKLPADDGKAGSAGARVRQMMCDYGLGFDCAGYTQQAFLAAHGLTRGQAGFADPVGESLSDLPSSRFARVPPEKAGPGDIVVLAPPAGESVGHRAIVRDRHELTPAELQRFSVTPEARARLAAGRVTVLDVDSSWGSGADPAKGGVLRRTWLYDAASGQWGAVDATERATVRLSAMPYANHPLQGIYHCPESH
jgi:hypothetical protein